MLKIAKEAEREGRLEDDGKTVTSIKETMERITQDTDYSQIIVSVRCCSKFPCDISKLLLLHNNLEVRSIFYERSVSFCTGLYCPQVRSSCCRFENNKTISALTYSEREKLNKLFGL